MQNRGPWSFFLPLAGLAGISTLTVLQCEGVAGFKPFLNLEAALLVLGGAAACLQVSYPLGEVLRTAWLVACGAPAGDEEEARRWGAVLRHAADAVFGAGGVVGVLGMILMLSSIDDVAAIPRRMALALTAPLLGMVVSEALFMPLARRVRAPGLRLSLPPGDGGRRRFLTGLGVPGGMVAFLFVILYSLSAAR
ncbi:MAG: hypothetical protein HY928_08685 [Elusimicrobia bacterium]|nr:hypothetical protein [Elusimicrobiota bacterium]